jgi:hypothetical protein
MNLGYLGYFLSILCLCFYCFGVFVRLFAFFTSLLVYFGINSVHFFLVFLIRNPIGFLIAIKRYFSYFRIFTYDVLIIYRS